MDAGGSYRLQPKGTGIQGQDRLFADKQHEECRHDQPGDVASSAPPRQDVGQNMGRRASWRLLIVALAIVDFISFQDYYDRLGERGGDGGNRNEGMTGHACIMTIIQINNHNP